MNPLLHGQPQPHLQPPSSASSPVSVSLKPLPFYDVHAELIPPSSLPTKGSSRFQEASFPFTLSLQQANDIALNRDMRMNAKISHLYQIQLRFCPLDTTKEQGDEFPPSICVEVNGKMCPLPNPIPSNKQGVEPKRPPKPTDITPLCKLSPALSNNIKIKWAAEHGKGWVVSVFLVKKLTSDQLLDRLKERGTKNKEFPQEMIKKKPNWLCPVCYSPALYQNLYLDGYFIDCVSSEELPEDENEIILNQDGTWKPIPRDEISEEERKREEAAEAKFSLGGGAAADVECIDID